MPLLSKPLFFSVSALGRPFGGIPPRRLTLALADRAFGDKPPNADDFIWRRDRWGVWLLLHPYYHIDRQIIAFGTFDAPLHRFIDSHVKPNMVCLDVGANIGSVGLHIAMKTQPGGRSYLFEPVPNLAARIDQCIKRNRLDDAAEVRRCALGDRVDTQSLNIPPDAGRNQGMASLVRDERDVLSEAIDVDVTTLDHFADAANLPRLDLIKLDIQGAEYAFLRGGEATIRRLAPLICMEVSPRDLQGAGLTSRDLLRYLASLGYDVFALRPDGRLGHRIDPEGVAADFSASNVVCRPKTRGAETTNHLPPYQDGEKNETTHISGTRG